MPIRITVRRVIGLGAGVCFFVFVLGCAFAACPGFFLAVLAPALRTGIPVCGVARQLIRRSTRTIGSRRGSAIACGNAQYTALSARNFQIGCSGRRSAFIWLNSIPRRTYVGSPTRVSMWFHWPRAAFLVRLADPTMLTHRVCPTWLNRKIFECRLPLDPRHDRRQERAKLTSAGDIPCRGFRRSPSARWSLWYVGPRRSLSRFTSSCTLTPRLCALISARVILASA